MSKQLIQSKSNFVEKVLRDKEGRLVRAKFQVYEVAGRIKVRLLDFTYIEALKGAVLKLAGFTKQKIAQVSQVINEIFKSPYFNTDTLSFNGSKPRAPTF